MRTVTIEFQHTRNNISYDVEADLIAIGAAPRPESDWDARDHFEIVTVDTYLDGELIAGVWIHDEVIYLEFLRQLRDAEVAVAFTEENGGF